VSGCTSLTSLDCSGNQLTSLEASDLTALKWLSCFANRLASLDVSGLTTLEYLNCSDNVLTSLNVSELKFLQTLNCSSNRLLSLNLTGLDNLKDFDGGAQTSSLTLSRDGNRYSVGVAINANTSFDNQAVSYTNGILTSTNSAAAEFGFNAPTGLANKTLSGVLILSYAGQPVPVLLDAPKDWSGSGTATARIDAPLADFIRLTLNGAEVDKANYSLTEGSTVITFKESYLKTFAVGTYTFTAVFAGGTVDIPLKVSAAGNSDKLPATGDSTAPLALCALLAGLGGVALVMRRRRLQA
jgi:LPXTG-motif cell wall-anchored protein